MGSVMTHDIKWEESKAFFAQTHWGCHNQKRRVLFTRLQYQNMGTQLMLRCTLKSYGQSNFHQHDIYFWNGTDHLKIIQFAHKISVVYLI